MGETKETAWSPHRSVPDTFPDNTGKHRSLDCILILPQGRKQVQDTIKKECHSLAEFSIEFTFGEDGHSWYKSSFFFSLLSHPFCLVYAAAVRKFSSYSGLSLKLVSVYPSSLFSGCQNQFFKGGDIFEYTDFVSMSRRHMPRSPTFRSSLATLWSTLFWNSFIRWYTIQRKRFLQQALLGIPTENLCKASGFAWQIRGIITDVTLTTL